MSTYGRIFSTCSSGSVDTIQRLAARSAGQLIREPLHFQRILDRDLLLGRERQRRPVAGVLAVRAAAIAVERHLHLDHHVDVLRLAAGRLNSRRDVGEQRIAIQFRCLAAGADESVAELAGVLGEHRARAPRRRSAARRVGLS